MNRHTLYTTEIYCERPTNPKMPSMEKPRPMKHLKKKPKPYGPALDKLGIVVTKDSPEWLKNIAMKLE